VPACSIHSRHARNHSGSPGVLFYVKEFAMKFLLFLILLVLCWPLALLALVLYPLVWIVLLPFRVVGIAVDGVLELIRAIFMLPVKMLRAV
jgi:hypothetical protein